MWLGGATRRRLTSRRGARLRPHGAATGDEDEYPRSITMSPTVFRDGPFRFFFEAKL